MDPDFCFYTFQTFLMVECGMMIERVRHVLVNSDLSRRLYAVGVWQLTNHE